MTNSETIRKLFDGLKPVQQEMFKLFLGYNKGRKYIIHCSRRLGKTYLLCILAIVFAIQKPNAQIRYASVTQKSVRKMIFPIMKQLFATMPAKYRGTWNSIEGAYKFPNGSFIHVAGVNNGHEDDLRGTSADLCLIDESAFCDRLEYLVESVLIPQLITTGGKLIMASSSPLSPAHEFAGYIHAARIGGYYSSFDINQGGYTPAIVQEFLTECGGANSTTAKREYFNELIVDSNMAIIPEWDSKFIQATAPDALRPFYHNYAAMDIGVRDFTVCIFGHYDFKKAKLIVEDEFSISGEDTTTRNIAAGIKAKEASLGYKDVYRRISDNNNLILLQDLGSEFDLHFGATNKESLAAMINEVRMMVDAGRVEVHPRCKQLIGCLTYGVYQDNKRKEFGRSKTYAHYDALAALVYLIRNLDQNTNPIPNTHGTNEFTHYTPPESFPQDDILNKIFNL